MHRTVTLIGAALAAGLFAGAALGVDAPGEGAAPGRRGVVRVAARLAPEDGDESEPGEGKGPDLTRPAPVPIQAQYTADRLVEQPPASRGGESFREAAPRGGVLVGVRVGYVDFLGAPKIGSLRPIFQVGDKYVLGTRRGAAIEGETTVVARPGYAVGGINTHAGLLVDALQLVFLKYKDGRLDRRDSYESAWLGDPRGGGLATLSGEGRLVAGLHGRSNGKEVNALGLIVVGPSPGKPLQVVNGPGPDPRKPAKVALDVKYDPERLAERPSAEPGPEGFRDVAPEGGVLVGFRVGYMNFLGAPKIGALQPIYQVGAKYVAGRAYGSPAVRPVTIVARPGYAVGGINAQRGLLLDAFQVVFLKVKDGQLDPDDGYLSPWLGDPRGGGPAGVSGEGRLVVGVHGRTNGKEINALGLVVED